jgi:6-phosphogluconate dehydrogenase
MQGKDNMPTVQADIGVIGLGVMGRNLALNIAGHGFSVTGLDQNDEKVQAFVDESGESEVHGFKNVDRFISSLRKPRVVLLLVPSGKPVDSVVEDLRGQLDPHDIVVDGGNSHFTDTDRHASELTERHIEFLGVGISGGAEGARHGPSMMPGGPAEAYKQVRDIFEATAANVDREPCVTYLGPRSAGHYVKMVHNGIEYALMQLIAESYDILERAGSLDNDEIADTFAKWNEGRLKSFLIEITANILRVEDPDTNQRLVDMILDAARQKGTGKWTSQDAMELQVPVPTIDAAVSMRDLSALKRERQETAKKFPLAAHSSESDKAALIGCIEQSLYFGMIAGYAQGMALLQKASEKYEYNLSLADIARIWRGGCIIRADLVDNIRQVFRDQPALANLMTAEPFAKDLEKGRDALCHLLQTAFEHEISVPAMASALAYFDGYRTFRLPANLIQAQRDYFGSHTYERVDREGTFHTEWTDQREKE